mmetsp:Transcript_18117/g.21754  ORF Transcript_18117/g.21754 Transcript_18117/m.21754 type:complete len:81 (+) Transcript_18117:143-385(+)
MDIILFYIEKCQTILCTFTITTMETVVNITAPYSCVVGSHRKECMCALSTKKTQNSTTQQVSRRANKQKSQTLHDEEFET